MNAPPGDRGLEAVRLDDVPVATLVVDAGGSITAANGLAGALLGQPPSSLLGCPLDDLLAPVAEGEPPPTWAGSWHPSSGPPAVLHVPEVAVDVRAVGGTVLRCHVSGRDLRGADGGLRGAVLALQPADPCGGRAPSAIEIVTAVSHELRSPLTSIKGYTSLLLHRWDGVPDDQRRAMLAEVLRDADRVARLLTELLDICRLETGRLHLRRTPVDLAALTGTVVDEVGLGHDGFTCALSFPDDLPGVHVDHDKVRQVLTNLVENAAKYGNPSGISVNGSLGPDGVSIAVADRGDGMPPSDMPLVFTQFFRRDLGRPSGAGLGLWMSRGLIEAHGGTLTVESRLGAGTTFRLTLPIDEPPTDEPPTDELEQRAR